jgi:glycosyltransferase involved in cell wall biosynthesis
MRIAYVYDAIYPYVAGGAERRNYEIGRRLAARGHDVQLIGFRWWDGEPVRAEHGMTLRGVGKAPALHDASGRRTFREALTFAARVAPALARTDADIIECSSIPYLPTFVAAALNRVRRVPLVVCWHEYMGEGWRAYAGRRATIAARVERQSARFGARRIAVSEFTMRRLPPGPPVSIVENGADVAAIAAHASTTRTVDVVAAGRLVPHKRINLLLQAIALLPGRTAQIIGDGPERARLEAEARALGIDDRVTFRGRLPDATAVYAELGRAKTALVSSEQEGFGIAVVEAQAAGTPPVVVRSALSAASELVADGETGLHAAAEPRAIADVLGRIIGDEPLRRRLGASAQTTAQAYDWEQVASRAETVYAPLIAAHTDIEPAQVRSVEHAEAQTH